MSDVKRQRRVPAAGPHGELTSNIQKGGALLEDSRRFVEVWDSNLSTDDNVAAIVAGNLLGKASQTRTDDVLRRILRPRFVEPGPQVIAALKTLTAHPQSFAEACYYEASRDDALLGFFAETRLMEMFEAGRIAVGVPDAVAWLDELAAKGHLPPWSETIQTKVSRGLLAALRDFGVLAGAVHKEILSPQLSLPGFAYVAFRLHEQGESSRAVVTSRVWRRWLLSDPRVSELFREADRVGLLRFSEAGSVVRVDWLVQSLPEVASVAT